MQPIVASGARLGVTTILMGTTMSGFDLWGVANPTQEPTSDVAFVVSEPVFGKIAPTRARLSQGPESSGLSGPLLKIAACHFITRASFGVHGVTGHGERYPQRIGVAAMRRPYPARPSCAPTAKRQALGASAIETAERCGSSCTQKRIWTIGQSISGAWCRVRQDPG